MRLDMSNEERMMVNGVLHWSMRLIVKHGQSGSDAVRVLKVMYHNVVRMRIRSEA
jgi:hypothetical protein